MSDLDVVSQSEDCIKGKKEDVKRLLEVAKENILNILEETVCSKIGKEELEKSRAPIMITTPIDLINPVRGPNPWALMGAHQMKIQSFEKKIEPYEKEIKPLMDTYNILLEIEKKL